MPNFYNKKNAKFHSCTGVPPPTIYHEGIKGLISNGQLPVSQIEGLVLTLTENGDEAYVEDDGTYRFSQLAVGKYTMQVSAPGYQEQLINDIAVNTGAYSTRNITLVPEAPVKEDAAEIK